MFYDFEKFYNKKIPKRSLFLDVGANEGLWSKKILQKFKSCKIIAVEPIKNLTYKNKKILIINKAVDINRGKLRNFYITREKVTSSLLKQERSIINKFITFKDKKGLVHKKSDYDVVKKIKVKTARLDDLIKKFKVKEIHYLKIDTEGNDLNVLKSLGKDINKVWGFELETWNEKKTLWKKQHWLRECINFIEKKNFKIVRKFIHGKGRSTDLLCVRKDIVKKL